MKPVPPTSPCGDCTRIITTLGRTRCATPATESGGRLCTLVSLPVFPPRLTAPPSSLPVAMTPIPAPTAPATSATISATTASRPSPGPRPDEDGIAGTGAQFGPVPGGPPNPPMGRGPLRGGGPIGAGGGPIGGRPT